MAVEFARFTAEELRAVDRIVMRARELYGNAGVCANPLALRMNLAAAHYTVPLRLAELAEADDTNLMHDVGGIARHLNRHTGELENCFLPRFAARRS